MSDFEPYFGVYWGPNEQTFGEFKAQTREFLEGLQGLHPVFKTWYELGNRMNAETPLGPNLEQFDAIMRERGWNKTMHKSRFSELDADGYPTDKSTVSVGWGCDFVTEPEAVRTHEYVYASISTGATIPRLTNSAPLNVYDWDSPLLDPEVSEQVFRYMINFWNPKWAVVTEHAYRSEVSDSETREKFGWLNYRADPSFADFLPPQIQHEPFNQGILFRIGDGRVLGENDREEIKLGLQIQQAILCHN